MVSSTVPDDENVAEAIRVNSVLGVPPGDYRLVGWDMDATGKRLIDEICQIAAYTPGSAYSQYVMPFKNLNPPAKKRHRILVVTIGRYRVMKDSVTNKVVPTKSEISALADFLSWLEKVKDDASDGIILVHHEPRKVNPSMLIEALTKYHMLDRFKETVKGFANGFDIAKAKCGTSLKVFSLRTLSRVFLDQEEELNSAVHRARLALQIVQHLSTGDENGNEKAGDGIGCGDSDATAKATVEFVREFVKPIAVEEKEHAALKYELGIQNTLKPIFEHLLGVSRRDRQHASRLRRLLAESDIDFKQLQDAWKNDKHEGLVKLVKDKIKVEKDIDEIIEVLDCYFDPEKKLPTAAHEEKKKFRKVKSEETKRVKSGPKENIKADVTTQSPDTTTCDSPVKEQQNDSETVATTDQVTSERNEAAQKC